MVGALGFTAVGLGAASRAPHRLHLSSRGLCGSKIEAMGTIGAAMATVETGVTGQGGAASLVRLGTSPGARRRIVPQHRAATQARKTGRCLEDWCQSANSGNRNRDCPSGLPAPAWRVWCRRSQKASETVLDLW